MSYQYGKSEADISQLDNDEIVFYRNYKDHLSRTDLADWVLTKDRAQRDKIFLLNNLKEKGEKKKQENLQVQKDKEDFLKVDSGVTVSGSEPSLCEFKTEAEVDTDPAFGNLETTLKYLAWKRNYNYAFIKPRGILNVNSSNHIIFYNCNK